MFEQIRGFSGFGFPKAHAVAFGLLAYQSTWLRVHYGPEFLCSLLNEQPMGFYPPDALVHEAQRRGIEVLAPDVNRSGVECSVEDGAVRVGLGYITGLRSEEARALVAERERGAAYVSLADLASRSAVGRDGLERLAWAGACEAVGGRGDLRRREDLWQLGVARGGERLPAGRRVAGANDAGSAPEPVPAPIQLSLPLPIPAAPSLRELDAWQRLVADYASTGIAIAEHPMALLRAELPQGIASSAALDRLADGRRVEAAGMVVARQRPATARGVVFMLLEDELGTINVVVPPPVYERHRLVVRTAAFTIVRGRLERHAGVVNVVAQALSPIATPEQPAAQVRPIEPPTERETGRSSRVARTAAADSAPARRTPTTHGSWPPWRRQRTASAGVVGDRCKFRCRTHVPSGRPPSFPSDVARAQSHRPAPDQRSRPCDRLRHAGRIRPRAAIRGRVLSRTSRPAIPTWSPARMGGVRDGPPRRLCNVVPA